MKEQINICRVCKAELHNEILVLQDMPLTDSFVKDGDQQEFLDDIHIFRCDKCSLVQNPVNHNYSGYYDEYEYSSGHSKFAKKFMSNYAKYTLEQYKNINGNRAQNIIEIGSGDGVQLKCFIEAGVESVLGVEPSKSLAQESEALGVPVFLGLFSSGIVSKLPNNKFDICISSYVLDHVPDPMDYLFASNKILSNNGLLAFEIHDLSQIYARSEWPLFEHEHTVYMDKYMATNFVEMGGFEVVSINPLKRSDVRANSLIVVAKKVKDFLEAPKVKYLDNLCVYHGIQDNIHRTISRIDNWVKEVVKDDKLIGWGVGGRGVMTLAAMSESHKFKVIVDSNYRGAGLLTPKTRVPISGIHDLKRYKDCFCLVFSFGYYAEIKEVLLEKGFEDKKIISLKSFY